LSVQILSLIHDICFLIPSFTLLFSISFMEHLWLYCNFSIMTVAIWIYHVFNKIDAFIALRFMSTGLPLAGERMRILPMTQHADNIRNEGKFLPLFTDHRRC
jgi:hypothetical protein